MMMKEYGRVKEDYPENGVTSSESEETKLSGSSGNVSWAAVLYMLCFFTFFVGAHVAFNPSSKNEDEVIGFWLMFAASAPFFWGIAKSIWGIVERNVDNILIILLVVTKLLVVGAWMILPFFLIWKMW